MNLPTDIIVIIYDYVADVGTDLCKTQILAEETTTSKDYLKALFGEEYEKFMYLDNFHKNIYNNRVRYLITTDCKKIKLCTNITGLVLKNDVIDYPLPDSLAELYCARLKQLPKSLPQNLRVLAAPIYYESMTCRYIRIIILIWSLYST